MRTVAEHFTRIRREHPTIGAIHAHRWAKHERATDELEARLCWDFESRQSPPVAVGHYVGDELHAPVPAIELRVYADDEPYEWGDIEPTEDDRRNLEVIGVGIGLAGEDDLESIWGYGYLSGDMTREAASCAIQCRFIELALRELAERERLAGFVETVA